MARPMSLILLSKDCYARIFFNRSWNCWYKYAAGTFQTDLLRIALSIFIGSCKTPQTCNILPAPLCTSGFGFGINNLWYSISVPVNIFFQCIGIAEPIAHDFLIKTSIRFKVFPPTWWLLTFNSWWSDLSFSWGVPNSSTVSNWWR